MSAQEGVHVLQGAHVNQKNHILRAGHIVDIFSEPDGDLLHRDVDWHINGLEYPPAVQAVDHVGNAAGRGIPVANDDPPDCVHPDILAVLAQTQHQQELAEPVDTDVQALLNHSGDFIRQQSLFRKDPQQQVQTAGHPLVLVGRVPSHLQIQAP